MEDINGTDYIVADYQMSPRGFYTKKMSSNFILNFSPLLTVYLIFGILTMIVNYLPENDFTIKLKRNFIGNGLLIVFMLTL